LPDTSSGTRGAKSMCQVHHVHPIMIDPAPARRCRQLQRELPTKASLCRPRSRGNEHSHARLFKFVAIPQPYDHATPRLA
jgi:hypothetical protein